MANLRIIYDNAADRAAITASSAAGTMTAERLLTDIKADVWRSSGTSATITATWTKPEIIAGIFLPFCNLSAQATIRACGYEHLGDQMPLFDTGTVEACSAPVLGLWGWGSQPLGSNAYAYGGSTYARVWVPAPGAVQKLVIDVSDPANKSGYIEAGRLVCGAYWEPAANADYGAPVRAVDTSKHYRTDAGDLVTDIGTRHRTQSIDLSSMNALDRATLWDIVSGNGMARPVLFSLYPNHADARIEQTHQMYAKLADTVAVTTPYLQRYATTLNLEEI